MSLLSTQEVKFENQIWSRGINQRFTFLSDEDSQCKFSGEFDWLLLMFQAERVIEELNKTFPADGLLPIYINPERGARSYSTITFGAMGDRYWPLIYYLFVRSLLGSHIIIFDL